MSQAIANPAGPSTDRAIALTSVLIMAVWFAAVIGFGLAETFEAGLDRPPLPLLVPVAGPPILFALAYRFSPRIRAFALGLDLRVLTAVQAWRVLGLVFLALYDYGLLPGAFAWPAGFGDGAVGVAAIFVLTAMLRDAPGWRRQVFWLNIAGLVDFAAAVGTGILTSNSALGILREAGAGASMGLFPLSLIPTFAVPMWIIFHMISLLQLRRG